MGKNDDGEKVRKWDDDEEEEEKRQNEMKVNHTSWMYEL